MTDTTNPTTPDQGDERRAFESAIRQLHPEWSFTTDPVFGYHNERTRCAWEAWQAARALSVAQPVAQEASKVEWVDGQGGRHAVTIPYAAELLKQLFDEWPDGVNEIEAALRWRDREIARLTSESVAVSGEVSDAEVEKLIDEWAEAAGVHFVYMSEHRATMARVLRNDVQQLARAVLALAGSAKQASALERMARLDDEMGIEP